MKNLIFALMFILISCSNSRDGIQCTDCDEGTTKSVCEQLTGATHFTEFGVEPEEGLTICLDTRQICNVGSCGYIPDKVMDHPIDSTQIVVLEKNTSGSIEYYKAEFEASDLDQDRDGDGVSDSQDACVDEAGSEFNNGCPWSELEKNALCESAALTIESEFSDFNLSFHSDDNDGSLRCLVTIQAISDLSELDLSLEAELEMDNKNYELSSKLLKDGEVQLFSGESIKVLLEIGVNSEIGTATFEVSESLFLDEDLKRFVLGFSSGESLALDKDNFSIVKTGQIGASEAVSISYEADNDAKYNCFAVSDIDQAVSIPFTEEGKKGFSFTYKDIEEEQITNKFVFQCSKVEESMEGSIVISVQGEDFTGGLSSVAVTVNDISILLDESRTEVTLTGNLNSQNSILQIIPRSDSGKIYECKTIYNVDSDTEFAFNSSLRRGYPMTYLTLSNEVSNRHEIICKESQAKATFRIADNIVWQEHLDGVKVTQASKAGTIVHEIMKGENLLTLTGLKNTASKIVEVEPILKSGSDREVFCTTIKSLLSGQVQAISSLGYSFSFLEDNNNVHEINCRLKLIGPGDDDLEPASGNQTS